MIYPDFLKKGDIIGVTAPSGGVTKECDIFCFKAAKRKLEARGYRVIFTDNVFMSDDLGRSTDSLTRAKEFMELIENKEVKYICSAKGGDFLMEILPYLDFDVIKKNPKWIQGYSDNTILTYNIATKCDIATVYGNNFGCYGMEEYHPSILRNLEIIEGKRSEQTSFDYYENEFYDKITGTESFRQDLPVNIFAKGVSGESTVEFSGRLIGGCLDVVMDNLGNGFDDTKTFLDKYKKDGIIWFLESFAATSDTVIRNMWKLKQIGFFENTTGIIFGREMFFTKTYERDFAESIFEVLKELEIPLIFGADIGHKAPQMTMITGALANVKYESGKINMTIKYKEK